MKAAHMIMVLESNSYSFFIFCQEVLISIDIINDEWKGRRMREHICHGRARCTNEVGGRCKYEVSPSFANLHERIPPPFANPVSPQNKATFIFLEGTWLTEIKYSEK